MNVLIINTYFMGGGAEKIARQLYYGLKKYDDMNTFFLSGRDKKNNSNIYNPTSVTNMVNRIFCFIGNNQRKHDKYALKKIIHVIENERIDIVHFHNIHGNYMGFEDIEEISKYCKIVWTLHDMWAFTGHCAYALECNKWVKKECRDCEKKWIYPKIRVNISSSRYKSKKHVFTNSNIIFVTPSIWLKEECKKSFLYNQKITTIQNGVNLEVFTEHNQEILREKYNIKNNKIILMFVSNQLENPFKGIDVLVNALNVVCNKKDYAIVICGNGSGISISNEYEIFNMGYINNDEIMSEIYSLSDVFILPSRAENYPCTILESLASGTPVIGSDAGGIPEQIIEGTGWIFPSGDYEALAKLIEKLDKKQLTTMRDRCRKAAENCYSEKEMIEKYYDLYTQIIND